MNRFRRDLSDKPDIKVSVPIREYMMCLNESNLNPISSLSGIVSEAFARVPLNRYVSDVTVRLKQALADYVGFGVSPSQILFGNGVDDMLYFIFTAVRQAESSFALSLAPSYFDYSTYSGCVGLRMESLDLTPPPPPYEGGQSGDFTFSTSAYLERLNHPDCVLGILCNPNNPTGHLLAESQILEIVENTQKPIIIDETYFEFSGVTFADKIEKYPHIIITRSFSKSFSAAGLRFGYVVSSEENAQFLNRVMPVFNCSILTQTIALTLLENKAFFAKNNQTIIAAKEAMMREMRSYPEVVVYPSYTNFLTFSLEGRAVCSPPPPPQRSIGGGEEVGSYTKDFFQYLLDRDISVRPVWGHPLLANHLRVTVCDSESNGMFLKALKDFLQRV